MYLPYLQYSGADLNSWLLWRIPIIYGQKFELIKALKVLNKEFTIGLHVN